MRRCSEAVSALAISAPWFLTASFSLLAERACLCGTRQPHDGACMAWQLRLRTTGFVVAGSNR